MKVPVPLPATYTSILISSGQEVDFSTPLFARKTTKIITIPLAQILGFSPEKIFMQLKKGVGDTVTKGELIAENAAFLSTKQYLAEFNGIIKEIDHHTGAIKFEIDGDDNQTVTCYFQGEIAAIHEDHIELKVNEFKKIDIHDAVESIGGEVFYHQPTNSYMTDEDIEGKIICSVSMEPMDIVKIEALGAKGYITHKDTSIKSRLKQFFLKEKEDFETLVQDQYPFCIIGPDKKTLYFYK